MKEEKMSEIKVEKSVKILQQGNVSKPVKYCE